MGVPFLILHIVIFPSLSPVINSFLFPLYLITLTKVFPSNEAISFIKRSLPGKPNSKTHILPFCVPTKINNFLKSIWKPLIDDLSEHWIELSSIGGNFSVVTIIIINYFVLTYCCY